MSRGSRVWLAEGLLEEQLGRGLARGSQFSALVPWALRPTLLRPEGATALAETWVAGSSPAKGKEFPLLKGNLSALKELFWHR
jgi:hypothetical protein